MEKTGNESTNEQEVQQDTEEITNGVLLITSQTINSDKAEPDERFFVDEEESPVVENKPKQSGTIFNNDMKKKIIKERRKEKIERLKQTVKKGIFGAVWFDFMSKILDMLLNIFSIGIIVTVVLATIGYFIHGNIFMSLVGCVMIVVSIYLNEKIG